MMGKGADNKDNGVPGPGNYESDISLTKDRSVVHKFGTGMSRAEVVSREAMSSPGPGGYESPEHFGKNGLKYSMRGKSPDERDNGIPGPGNYNADHNATKDKVISYKMGSG